MTRKQKNTLTGLSVSQAMRRLVVKLRHDTPLGNSVNALIKYKINALLTVDAAGAPAGVLSKTDVMGAYYAGLPAETPVADVMSAPPLFCRPDDSLEDALEQMRAARIYRLYVAEPGTERVVGALAYPDIVGLLYRYCHDCEQSRFAKRQDPKADAIKRFHVREVMTQNVESVFEDDPLVTVMEALSAYRFGAILVRSQDDAPAGVVSKTDLVLAYKHGTDPETPARAVMSAPVLSCAADDVLEDAIRRMIFTDVHRLFVHQYSPANLVGVVSLTDAARIRSGSCHACVTSRIRVDSE